MVKEINQIYIYLLIRYIVAILIMSVSRYNNNSYYVSTLLLLYFVFFFIYVIIKYFIYCGNEGPKSKSKRKKSLG